MGCLLPSRLSLTKNVNFLIFHDDANNGNPKNANKTEVEIQFFWRCPQKIAKLHETEKLVNKGSNSNYDLILNIIFKWGKLLYWK